jgi:aminopeptidase N
MGVRSLTQAEAERRAALLAVERYDVAVDLTDLPTGPEVRCVSTVTFACREPGATTFVDCAAEVRQASLNGVPLSPAAGGRIELANLAERNTLLVESVQANTTHGEGVHKAVDPADKEVYVWMSFEPDSARYVWACFDQPDLKAPHAFTVTAPGEWTVTSNRGEARVEWVGSARRWTFPDTPPLSTYNTVVNAGPLHEIRRRAGGYDLGLFSRRSMASVLERDADEIFRLTEQGLGFFANAFGMPFPQSTYDQVFMPEFGGAMENYGCVTWTDSMLRWSAPTPAERELFAKVLLHEMAHMWFGNIVTMRWWDDLWLNEAFATFAANWAAERATAYTDAWASHLATGKLAAYLADQGPTSHAIRQPIRDVAEAAATFDAITYPKGASVLHQLMAYVGESTFTAGMTDYFARHAWGNTTLQDLMGAIAAASGRDLDAWRAAWLETAGTDRLTLERDGDDFVLVADTAGGAGQRGTAGGRPRPQVVAIGVYRREADGLARTARVDVEVAEPVTAVDVPPGADFYLVNDDDLTFAAARPDAGSRAALVDCIGGLPSVISRGVAMATVWDLLINGEATAADTARCITAVAAVETSDSVIEPYLLLAGEVAQLWSPAAERAAISATVAATCRDLVARPDRRHVALRALTRVVGDLDEVAWLEEQAGDDMDLRWRALVRKAELGGDTAAEVASLRERDPDPEAWTRAVAVRAATPDAGEKEAAWLTLAVDRALPISTAGMVAWAFWRPGQDELLRPYRQRYLDLVPELSRGGMIQAAVYTYHLFPTIGIDLAFLERAEAAGEGTVPLVRKTLLERADLVRRMLRSRG